MNKKKVGIVTIIDFNNYGNRLQNYAVSKFSNTYFDSETIYILENNYSNKIDLLFYRFLFMQKVKIYLAKLLGKNYIKNEKKYNFLLFSKNNIPLKFYFKNNSRIQADLSKIYKYFIVGSDQVWNPLFGCGGDIEYLTFANKEQKICFSPSFGISELPENHKEFVKKSLLDFDKISVREQAGQDIIYNLTGKKAEVLIDPTMMLTAKEWLKVAKKVNTNSKVPYILTYFLGEKDEEREKSVKCIAKKYNLKEYRLLDLSQPELYKAGPSEFIQLINDAALVCTDSFHAIVFSIIFKVPFIAYNRAGGPGMNSRINTLLQKFKLEDREFNKISIDDVLKCEYSNIDSILELERQKVLNFFDEYIK